MAQSSGHSGNEVSVTEVTRSGVSGDALVATLVRPASAALGGVLIAHGGTDDGRRFFLAEAIELAEAGMAVLLPVIRFPPHGDAAESEAAVDRGLRHFQRGLDVLRDDAGADRLCFFGHSGGAALGAQFAGADDRLEAVVLAGIGAGTVGRHAEADLRRAGHPDIDPYLSFLDRYDPRHHLARYPGRLLIQHGRHDDAVTTEESLRMRDAAGPAAQWVSYDDGHGLAEPPARRDRRAFLLSRR